MVTWGGGIDNSWQNPANWAPARVPTSSDDVTIPSGTLNAPTLFVDAFAHNLTVAAPVNIDLITHNLNVSGNAQINGNIHGAGALVLTGGGQLSGSVFNVVISGAVTLTGSTVIGGDLTITGVGASLDPNGFSASVTGNLSVQGAGRLIETNAASSLSVGASAVFDGASEAGFLTAGDLTIGGGLTQAATSSGESFSASGTHRTVFTSSASPTIAFATPGAATGTSHFGQLRWTGSGTLNINSDVYALGTFDGSPGLAGSITSSGHKVQVGGLISTDITFNNTKLVLFAPTGGPLSMAFVTFINMSPLDTQLAVTHPGAAAPFVFDNLNFQTAPTGAGRYLVATDADGASPDALTINVTSSTPAAPSAALFSATNGAIINWPATAPVVTWTGAISSTWSTAGNWSTGVVPGATDAVDVPATGNNPALGSSVSVRSLTVEAGATVTITDATLTVSDGVNGAGQILTPGGGMVSTGSTASTITGNLGSLTANGPVTVSGRTTMSSGDVLVIASGGSLALGGHTLVVGSFSTTGTGTLTMNNTLDSLIVLGNATFNGGDESGLLTAGVLDVRQGFVQDTTTSQSSFTATGAHKTRVGAGSGGSISFASPGASGFQDLVLEPSDGTTQFLSNVVRGRQLPGHRESAPSRWTRSW